MQTDKQLLALNKTEPTLTDIACWVARLDELDTGLTMYDAQYMQHT